jgi:HSP20 family protein
MNFSPAVEAFIDKDNKKFHCEVVLPGVDPKDVEIQVQGNSLTITGERTNSRETREADFLPEGVHRDRLPAEYRNGMLEITAPIATASLPKRVVIKSLPASRAVSA